MTYCCWIEGFECGWYKSAFELARWLIDFYGLSIHNINHLPAKLEALPDRYSDENLGLRIWRF